MSIRRAIAEFLAVQETPFYYTAATLVEALDLNPASEFKRRHRDLRDYGWVIETYRDNPALGLSDFKLVAIGSMPK